MCVAKFGAGSVCAVDNDCLNNNCRAGEKICAANCLDTFGKGVTSSGCTNGLRDVSFLLGFGALGLIRARRRK